MIRFLINFLIPYLIVSIIISALATKLFYKASKSSFIDCVFYFVVGVVFWPYLVLFKKDK